MKTQDFDTLNIGPDDDDINDPANQEDYPETADLGRPENSGAGDELDSEDTDDEWDDLTDTEDINENEDADRSERSANDVDGNGGYPDERDAISAGS